MPPIVGRSKREVPITSTGMSLTRGDRIPSKLTPEVAPFVARDRQENAAPTGIPVGEFRHYCDLSRIVPLDGPRIGAARQGRLSPVAPSSPLSLARSLLRRLPAAVSDADTQRLLFASREPGFGAISASSPVADPVRSCRSTGSSVERGDAEAAEAGIDGGRWSRFSSSRLALPETRIRVSFVPSAVCGTRCGTTPDVTPAQWF